MTEWLDPEWDRLFDLVLHEISQRRETGHDTSEVEARLAELSRDDSVALADLFDDVCALPRSEDWPFVEPSDLEGIEEVLSLEADQRLAMSDGLVRRIEGAWVGRIAGCMLGKPVEAERWSSSRIREYLEVARAYPLSDYIPVLEPMPEGFEFRESWPETTRGRISGSARDDDIDYTILALHLLEVHGNDLRRRHVAEAWTRLLPYQQVFTAERVAYRNLVSGVALGEVATHRNPYREWIGAQIRGDLFGWVHPGAPRTAATAAFQDASLSHIGNGIYGEMWVAALCALIPVATSIPEAIVRSLEHIPPQSRLADAIANVISIHESGANWDEALAHIQDTYGHYHIVHTINNAAVVVAGLLWGDHDYARTVGLTVQAGWDTDSNGATAGSVVGLFLGGDSIPDRFGGPLEGRVRSALFGFDNATIAELVARTCTLVERLGDIGAVGS